MRVLALESSCDDSCVAILETQGMRLLADVVESHTTAMQGFGGIVPEVASRRHLTLLPAMLDRALSDAQLTINQVNWIVATHRPGLIGSLMVGASFAKALSLSLKRPFTFLNHLEAHALSPFLALTQNGDPPPLPWIALVVSGGHTELLKVRSDSRTVHLGGTLDDAAGEAFDKIGKLLGLSYPAGPKIDRWVRESATDADRLAFRFPRSLPSGYQFSFSGLKTAVMLAVKKTKEECRLSLVASAQEAIIDCLVIKSLLALEAFPDHQLIVAGGVACNSRLRERLPNAYFPKPAHCTDNAAMVAMLASIRFQNGMLEPSPADCSVSSSY